MTDSNKEYIKLLETRENDIITKRKIQEKYYNYSYYLTLIIIIVDIILGILFLIILDYKIIKDLLLYIMPRITLLIGGLLAYKKNNISNIKEMENLVKIQLLHVNVTKNLVDETKRIGNETEKIANILISIKESIDNLSNNSRNNDIAFMFASISQQIADNANQSSRVLPDYSNSNSNYSFITPTDI